MRSSGPACGGPLILGVRGLGGEPMFGWFRKKPPRPNGPDFSAIDSREKAVELFERGELEKLFLMPPEFGGMDNALNALFVPVGLASIKAGIDDNVIAPLAADGKITHLARCPSTKGGASSRSPSRSWRPTRASSARPSTSGARPSPAAMAPNLSLPRTRRTTALW